MKERRRLGILQCGHTPTELVPAHGEYADMFIRLLGADSFDYSTYPVVDGQFPGHHDAADAWLLTGSRHGVYEGHDWIAPLEDWVRKACERRQPVVGICFGHQLLAQAMGGRVEKFAGGWSIGRVQYALDEIFDDNPAPLIAFHQDQVIEPPPGATVVGASSFCRYAALRYGGLALGLQPHPEFDDAFLRDLIACRGDLLPESQCETALDSLGAPLGRAGIARTLVNFLNQ